MTLEAVSSFEIHQFTCRSDNFGVLVHDTDTGLTATIDAPDADEIIHQLQKKGWNLSHILITHHHHDHTGGIAQLVDTFGCHVIGPKAEQSKINGLNETVSEGDIFSFSGHEVEVIETPGHTAGHVCYYFSQDGLLFAGDTLFSLGCGRLFEGDGKMMWDSLSKLIELPDETKIFCGHEYTLSNAEFALTVEPGNLALQERAKEVRTLREAGEATLPTTLEVELETNPFLRPSSTEIRQTMNMETEEDWEVFQAVRLAKDNQ